MSDVSLSYIEPTILQTAASGVPSGIFENTNNYTASLTMRTMAGTPYQQINELAYEIRRDTKQFVVNGYGGGFVNGHVLSVSVTIFKKYQ